MVRDVTNDFDFFDNVVFACSADFAIRAIREPSLLQVFLFLRKGERRREEEKKRVERKRRREEEEERKGEEKKRGRRREENRKEKVFL